MAILYVFKANDPNNAGGFPPSVVSSSWFTNLNNEMNKNGLNSSSILFDSETELNTWLSTYRLTDADLLSDIATWKSAHGVSYSNKYYSLNDASVSVNGILS